LGYVAKVKYDKTVRENVAFRSTRMVQNRDLEKVAVSWRRMYIRTDVDFRQAIVKHCTTKKTEYRPYL
jgi:hypothetical protein